jgi:GNAT superfamily N-acetyltransferase
MSIVYKVVYKEGLQTLVEMRVEFIRDLHPEYSKRRLASIRGASAGYFKGLFREKAYMGFIGTDECGEITCTAGLLLYSLPPLRTAAERKIGHVLNFYTRPGKRNKGYATGLMKYIIKTAKKKGINRLSLNSTKAGYGLYKKCGFNEPEEKAMVLEIM